MRLGLLLLLLALPLASAQGISTPGGTVVVDGDRVCGGDLCVGDPDEPAPGPSDGSDGPAGDGPGDTATDGADADGDDAGADASGAPSDGTTASGDGQDAIAPAPASDEANMVGIDDPTAWAVVAAVGGAVLAALAAQTGWAVRAGAWVARGAVAVFLFSRIHPDKLAKHPVRAQMLDLVRAEPGIPLQEIQRRVDVAWGTAVYHLNRLEKERLLVSHRTGNKRLFFVANTPVAKLRQGYGLVQAGTSRRIAKTVLDQPGLDQKSVCRMLRIGNPTASKHLARLEKEGLVLVEKESRRRLYRPTPALQDVLAVQATAA